MQGKWTLSSHPPPQPPPPKNPPKTPHQSVFQIDPYRTPLCSKMTLNGHFLVCSKMTLIVCSKMTRVPHRTATRAAPCFTGPQGLQAPRGTAPCERSIYLPNSTEHSILPGTFFVWDMRGLRICYHEWKAKTSGDLQRVWTWSSCFYYDSYPHGHNTCWLVVWNINFIFPYIGYNHPNWLSYFSEG